MCAPQNPSGFWGVFLFMVGWFLGEASIFVERKGKKLSSFSCVFSLDLLYYMWENLFLQGVLCMPTIAVKKLDERAVLPKYGSEFAAGADLYAVLDEEITFAPDQTILVRTGLAMEIPEGYAGFIYARSGLASKRGLAPANKVGVVDADYRGEVMVALHNHSAVEQKVAPGERIAQLVVAPFLKAVFEEAQELSDTVRGEGGFGSTGSK